MSLETLAVLACGVAQALVNKSPPTKALLSTREKNGLPIMPPITRGRGVTMASLRFQMRRYKSR